MVSKGLLTHSPAHEPLWVWLYTEQFGNRWAAMILDDQAPVAEPGCLAGLAFFGETPEEAEHAAKVYLGHGEPVN